MTEEIVPYNKGNAISRSCHLHSPIVWGKECYLFYQGFVYIAVSPRLNSSQQISHCFLSQSQGENFLKDERKRLKKKAK